MSNSNSKKYYAYICLFFVVVVFGLWAVPKLAAYLTGKSDLILIGPAPAFSFTDQDHSTITRESYRGKVFVVEFFFTSCPGICITMNKNLQRLEKAFFGNANFGIASITIDPEHDTPERLKAYAKKYEASPNWHFLTGNKDSIYDLANQKFRLYAGANADLPERFEHSGMFVLVDKEGFIRSRKDSIGNPIIYYDGTSAQAVDMLKEDIRKMLN